MEQRKTTKNRKYWKIFGLLFGVIGTTIYIYFVFFIHLRGIIATGFMDIVNSLAGFISVPPFYITYRIGPALETAVPYKYIDGKGWYIGIVIAFLFYGLIGVVIGSIIDILKTKRSKS